MNCRVPGYEFRSYRIEDNKCSDIGNCDTAKDVMWSIEGEREWLMNTESTAYRWEVIRMSDGVILAESRQDTPGTMQRLMREQQEGKG